MNIGRKTLRYIFLGAAGCIVFYWLLFDTERVRSVWNFISAMISPFVIGAGIAFVLNVPMRGIENRLRRVKKQGLRRAIALLLTFIVILFVVFLVVQLLIPQIIKTVQKLVAQLPAFSEGIGNRFQSFLDENPQIMEWLSENTDFEQMDWSGVVEKLITFLGDSMSNILLGTLETIGNLSTGIFNGVIAFVFALYCLFRKEILARQARRLVYAFLPERVCDESIRILRLTGASFSNFLSGQCLEACVLGTMFAICMLIFRMPYVPLISVLVAICALVPIVGAFVGCILGTIFILVDGDPMKAVWFVVMFLVIQQFEGNVIYPKVVGKSVGLSGMWVLVAVAVGGALMGIVGMFIMIPIFSVLHTLLREITEKRLSARQIDKEKLRDHPQELRTIFKRRKKAVQTQADNSATSDEPASVDVHSEK